MGKNKRKSSRPQVARATWDDEDRAELIAWLDHSLRYGTLDFSSTIIQHLRRSRHKEFTVEQVHRRLETSWRNYGSDSSVNWRALFQHGSAILPLLPDEEEQLIALAQARLESDVTSVIFTPRRLRSRSTQGDSRLSPHISLEYLQTPQKPQYQKNKTQTASPSPFSLKRENKPVDAATQTGTPPAKRAKTALEIDEESPSFGASQLAADETIEHKLEPTKATSGNAILVVNDSEEDVNNESEEEEKLPGIPGQQQHAQEHPEDQREMHNDKDDTSDNTLSDADSDRASQDTEDSLEEENLKFRKEHRPRDSVERARQVRLDRAITEYQEVRRRLRRKDSELCRKDVELQSLRDSNGILESAQKQRDRRIGGSFEALIAKKDRSIADLVGQLKTRRSLGAFTKLSRDPPPICLEPPIAQSFTDIYFEIRNILYQAETHRPFFFPALEGYSDLKALICRGQGRNPDAGMRITDTKGYYSKIGAQMIIRALATSAIREWVFEDEFPNFGTKSKLLTHYRENVATVDGPFALRNLDLAAHSSIITSDEFRERIRKRACGLAKRFSKTVQPFFVNEPDAPSHSDLDGFKTWGQVRNEFDERRNRLKNIFTIALKAKAKSLLHFEEYEMVMYEPGTKFDKAAMVVESINGVPQEESSFEGRFIELCIEAALFSYPKKMPGEGEAQSISEVTVRSKNFFLRSDDQRQGKKPLVKAVVILRDEQFPSVGLNGGLNAGKGAEAQGDDIDG